MAFSVFVAVPNLRAKKASARNLRYSPGPAGRSHELCENYNLLDIEIATVYLDAQTCRVLALR
jgi:hypothetical protein